jgi:hypothetical protein
VSYPLDTFSDLSQKQGPNRIGLRMKVIPRTAVYMQQRKRILTFEVWVIKTFKCLLKEG